MPSNRTPVLLRLLELRLLTVALLLLIGFLAVSFGREMIRSRSIARDVAALEAEAASLQAKHLEITRLADTFQTEAFIEREGRLKLGLKKPGEEVVVIHEGTPSPRPQEGANDLPASDPSLSEESGSVTVLSNPEKWWIYFFDRARFDLLSSYDS